MKIAPTYIKANSKIYKLLDSIPVDDIPLVNSAPEYEEKSTRTSGSIEQITPGITGNYTCIHNWLYEPSLAHLNKVRCTKCGLCKSSMYYNS